MQDTDAGGLEDDWDALARLCGRKDWNRFLCTACWVVRSGYLVYVGGRREDRKVFADRILKSGYIEGTILRRVGPKVKGEKEHWTTRKHEDGNS